ncbi:MAG: GNAT family N-acetyltransferase [Proteobacteria bacterium]|nr:GNAT family N-acetyltransferase [Pseudomonadota bacterium]
MGAAPLWFSSGKWDSGWARVAAALRGGTAGEERRVYHFPPAALTAEGFREQITQLRVAPGWCPFAIVPLERGKAAGVTCYLDIRPDHRAVEIGFTWLAAEYHGTKLNPECKYLLLRHAFDEHDALRVQLKTDGRNTRSQRAIEKLGAVREGVLRLPTSLHLERLSGHRVPRVGGRRARGVIPSGRAAFPAPPMGISDQFGTRTHRYRKA